MPRLETILQQRLGLGRGEPVHWIGTKAIVAEDALTVGFRTGRPPPGSLVLNPRLFPYDASQQTFVNIYDDGTLRQQFVFSAGSPARTYYRGTTSGAVAVIRTFVPAGVHHIWVGADHLLFLFGLILLGGGPRRVALIITAFTIGHSITLSLAVLDIVSVPARLIEPAIALTIVVVGADNLLRRRGAADLRTAAAALFGLIHGFGFATVLKELGLPREALGWSLFSFNVGVELGQLAIVIVAASLFGLIRRNGRATKILETSGSAAVIAGGTYWFVQRVFF
jgi:hydrogenase/urease accessory protein HupE